MTNIDDTIKKMEESLNQKKVHREEQIARKIHVLSERIEKKQQKIEMINSEVTVILAVIQDLENKLIKQKKGEKKNEQK